MQSISTEYNTEAVRKNIQAHVSIALKNRLISILRMSKQKSLNGQFF